MKHNIRTLQEMKQTQTPISWLTCYEYSFATALNATSLDMVLVGDSGGMVSLGYQDTSPVTMDEMIQLASAVRRGAPDKFIVGDMPKGSYEATDTDAVKNAMRFMKESSCDAVKLEGGAHMADRVRAITKAGIPTVGHIGLTPQSSGAFGGYRVVGRSESELSDLRESVIALENSGVFAILLEAVPTVAAQTLTNESNSIILGIGAGKHTDGQLLILHDLLGLYPTFRPKFAKCYVPQVLKNFSEELLGHSDLNTFGRSTRKDGIHEITRLAVESYVQEVKSREFPGPTFSYKDQS
jgi:3-methyl-2-oxobutanoate hydroxymethyltransferase